MRPTLTLLNVETVPLHRYNFIEHDVIGRTTLELAINAPFILTLSR